VAIDVNSGRATRERHIEETALRTNLEAAEEIARQLRLRDLAGLVVIDFIDMENHRNRGLVERRLRDAMKNDRARIQLGHISAFGLMELSRQRLRPSLLETSFEGCVHCRGTGVRPTTESSALAMLRRIEEEALGRRFARIAISIPTPVAMYLLNEKRDALSALEAQYGLEIAIKCEDSLVAPDFGIERVKISSLSGEEGATDEEVEATESREDEGAAAAAAAGHAATTEREETGKRGRRRRPRRRRPSGDEEALAEEAIEDAEASEETMEAEPLEPDEEPEQDSEQGSEPSSKKRRRGKRGGRRRSRKSNGSEDLVSPPGVEPEAGVLVGAMSSDAVGDEPLPVANIEAQVELEGESQSHPASELDAIDSSKDRARPRRRGGRGRTRGRPADEEAGADSPAVESEQPREVEILGDSVDEPEPSALTANTELATELVSEREPQSGSYATASEEPEESQMTSAPSSDHVDQDKDPAEDMPAHSRESGLEVSAEDEDSTVSEDSERVFHVGRDQRDPMPTEPRKGWWQRFLE
jgi:ribonuclease E